MRPKSWCSVQSLLDPLSSFPSCFQVPVRFFQFCYAIFLQLCLQVSCIWVHLLCFSWHNKAALLAAFLFAAIIWHATFPSNINSNQHYTVTPKFVLLLLSARSFIFNLYLCNFITVTNCAKQLLAPQLSFGADCICFLLGYNRHRVQLYISFLQR